MSDQAVTATASEVGEFLERVWSKNSDDVAKRTMSHLQRNARQDVGRREPGARFRWRCCVLLRGTGAWTGVE